MNRFKLWLAKRAIKRWLKSPEGQATMDAIKNFGAGYRTYGVVIIMLLCVAAEKLFGWDIPGFDLQSDWFKVVLEALGLGALRAAVPGK